MEDFIDIFDSSLTLPCEYKDMSDMIYVVNHIFFNTKHHEFCDRYIDEKKSP